MHTLVHQKTCTIIYAWFCNYYNQILETRQMSTNNRMDKLWYVLKMKSYAEMKINKLLQVWLKLKNIVEWKKLEQKNTYYLNPSMFHYIIGSETDKMNLMLGVWIPFFGERLEEDRELLVTSSILFLDLGGIYSGWCVLFMEIPRVMHFSVCMLCLN